MYRPPTINDTGTEKWIEDNTPIGYKEFMYRVSIGVKPAALARSCKKDSRTITDWLNRIARDNGHKDWHGLYN